ncbi:TM2 domain-containing protein [Gleimia europaea]|uniref:TM2 domain-containing protein n=1 Tax=Gleimia europaea ACS-120-V-Col10b TaxID=883069 RepID=A0A9W5RCU9_9ACTO|nr:TM2 domain-containing protein [Gleimia europaea]EPD29439.1 hypothetical protein HMPREF9238_01575 [Gleimia europaea ACS-120-V-Col10b]
MSAFPQPERYWNPEGDDTRHESKIRNASGQKPPQFQDITSQLGVLSADHANGTPLRAPRKPRAASNSDAEPSTTDRVARRPSLQIGEVAGFDVTQLKGSTKTGKYEGIPSSRNNRSKSVKGAFQSLTARRDNRRSTSEKPKKDRIVAGVTAILLGAFGTHNFYLGKYKLALIQLLITLLSALGLAPVVAMWGVFEGLMYLFGSDPKWKVDGWGRPLAN